MLPASIPSLAIVLLLFWDPAIAAPSCVSDSDCSLSVGAESFCRADTQTCSNPFEQGCLHRKISHWDKKRVCNSDDPKDAVERGICRQPERMDYMELRIFAENWETVFFESWILQIILSELLDVPTTIETGSYEARLNFYDPDGSFDYGPGWEVDALRRGNELGDCRKASRTIDNYESCAHFVPEVWEGEKDWERNDLVKNNEVEPPQSLGMIGQEGWYISKLTLERDPSLGNYLGLQNQREKLADMFLRPATWKVYCDDVSPNQCATPDETASRPPRTKEEEDRMFVEGLFTGYFRKTEENDCVTWPQNCTGHIGDFPCGWTSGAESTAHHLNISLKSSGTEPYSNGYQYQQLVDMWHAANATRSNLIMFYWNLDTLFYEFQGKEAEFTKVVLPPPTRECYDHKILIDEQCSELAEVRLGVPQGVCDEIPDSLDKIITGSLHDVINHPDIPDGARSPGYEVLKSFKVNNLQMGEILQKYWVVIDDPREAICQWAADNMDYLESFIPLTHPRRPKVLANSEDPFLIASTFLGLVATLLCVGISYLIWKKRKERSVLIAQVGFCLLVLFGSGVIAVGATLTGVQPTDATCVISSWLIAIGYTLAIVPTIIKVAAIHRMVSAAERLRRIVVNRRNLHGVVAIVVCCVLLCLSIWTIVDPLRMKQEFHLKNEVDSNGFTIVEIGYYCSSRSSAWEYVSISWIGALLLVASAIAFQTRKLNPTFNESRTLAFMIYSHFMGVGLRFLLLAVSDSIRESHIRYTQSLIYSIDTIAALLIYFIPILTVKSPVELRVYFEQPTARRPNSELEPRNRVSHGSNDQQFNQQRHEAAQPCCQADDLEELEKMEESTEQYVCSRCGIEVDPLVTAPLTAEESIISSHDYDDDNEDAVNASQGPPSI